MKLRVHFISVSSHLRTSRVKDIQRHNGIYPRTHNGTMLSMSIIPTDEMYVERNDKFPEMQAFLDGLNLSDIVGRLQNQSVCYDTLMMNEFDDSHLMQLALSRLERDTLWTTILKSSYTNAAPS